MLSVKVCVITFHFVNNFGGALQAYALQKAISDNCNAECEVIDYRNWFIRFTDTVRLFPVTGNVKEIGTGLKTMGKRVGRLNKFKKFISENCTLTEVYGSRMKMKSHPPKADKYVCGSDQIWNPVLTMGVSPNYFLGFVENPDDKIAYAPSFGKDTMSASNKKKVKQYLESFGHLSVREQSGQKMIKDMTGRDAEQLIDPTFLIDKKDWEALAVTPDIKEKYILLYIMQKDDEVYEYARKMKEKLGIKLVEISRYGYNPGFVDETLIDVGPREFLGLFRDAAYVCTNSFHGLAYSVIFEKDFCLIPCKRFTTRSDNMRKLLHIEANANLNDENSLTAVYDKEYVKSIIKGEREKAIRYLKEGILE